jgi:hypothetical protein
MTLHYMERVLTDQRHDGWFALCSGRLWLPQTCQRLQRLQRLQRIQRAPTTGRHGCCYAGYAQATRRLRGATRVLGSRRLFVWYASTLELPRVASR